MECMESLLNGGKNNSEHLCYFHHEFLADKRFEHGHESILFNMKNIPNTEAIHRAELHLFKDATKLSGDQPKAFLHAHLRKGSSQRVRRSLVDWRNLNSNSSGWEKFDVTPVILDWIKNPTSDSKFTVEVIDGPNGLKMSSDSMNLYKASGEISTHEWEQRRPFLVIESNEGNKRRSRRGLRGQRGNPESNRHGNTNRARKLHEKAKLEMCRRRNFYLDFAKIGWSKQIVSPMGFDMYFCQGTCPKPLGPHMNTTNHAVIQNQVNNFEPTLVPPPCCVPSSLGDQSFLYINHENQIVMKTYCDIVVEGCGCR